MCRAFGAPGHVRVSYGSLPERECLVAIERLAKGLKALTIGAGKPMAVTLSLEGEKDADRSSKHSGVLRLYVSVMLLIFFFFLYVT